MTIDERLQFLLQSTESLHSNVAELHASTTDLRSSITEMRVSIQDLKRVVEIDADNIRRLANIAAAHDDGIDDLRTRVEKLERKAQGRIQ